MRIIGIVLILFLFLSTITFASEPIIIVLEKPRLNVCTNKCSYFAGEIGELEMTIDSLGMISEAEVEVEVLSPEGKLVYGDLFYTEMPAKTLLNPYTEQTQQVIYHEHIDYLSPEKTVKRNVYFEIPLDAPTGEYTINVKLFSPDLRLEKTNKIYINGGEETVDLIIIFYILVLAFSLYLLWER